MVGSGVRPGRIFISYRRQDSSYPAGWLFDRLREHFGPDQVFKDVDSIELGDDVEAVISAAVGSCDVLLAVIGPRWVSATDGAGRRRLDSPDDYVRREIATALAGGVRVIPVLVDGAVMPRTVDVPPVLLPLLRLNALVLSPDRFGADTARLLRALDRAVAEAAVPRTPHEAVAPVPPPGDPAPGTVALAPERGGLPVPGRRGVVGAAVTVPVLALIVAAVAVHPWSSDTPDRARSPAPASTSLGGTVRSSASSPSSTSASPPAGPVLLSDDFSTDRSGWTVRSNTTASGTLRNGRYHVMVTPNPVGTGVGVYPERVSGVYPTAPDNLHFRVSGRRLPGSADLEWGVSCRSERAADTTYGYLFTLTSGDVQINKNSARYPYDPELLKSARHSLDTTKVNTVEGECATVAGGVHLSLSVNDVPLVDYLDQDAPLTFGTVNLFIGMAPAARGTGDVEFDDVRMWRG
ncbi:MAG TPA: toll/interleukin-1 receptor domain-containing protein [Kineosporiaceae bacterium]